MGSTDQLEVEVKFSVDDATPVPDFSSVEGVTEVGSEQRFTLSATYYDTPDLSLTRNKITLRRRSGGPDEGWHLKLLGTRGRREVHAPLDAGDATDPHHVHPPRTLLEALRVALPALAPSDDRPMGFIAIAQVDNERHVTDLMVDSPGSHQPTIESKRSSPRGGAESCKGAEFCDDHVSSRGLLEGGQAQHWREWEIELSPDILDDHHGGADQGDIHGFADDFLDRLSERALAAGAKKSSSPSKLVMAMGDTMPN
ncbi:MULTISPECIES: CYTH domain-containing protein [Corynebacterium]|uniref:CYTH domain-containing protein n=1 Tax=Corynebacterium TaxID=1716 RepID=UPI00195764C9|nr:MULTISPECIES: CYTH domain-containing protein [Corynebacterium]MDN8625119.1 CYTH domain-containing protein [Corynebacterium kroppenstedtii]QRQ64871.1 CYTH domain-containing protein [Corynebacterium kroppenstedtii]